ncbi:unnamed protein product [Cuscuta campestris]|uniref:Uncharacterized protein n=1 Tax=Cuscuta campestris TaxID=132261 RepID=A0A484M528_9ASTE|nr:unnamed protein product [Cuscuta campestris]
MREILQRSPKFSIGAMAEGSGPKRSKLYETGSYSTSGGRHSIDLNITGDDLSHELGNEPSGQSHSIRSKAAKNGKGEVKTTTLNNNYPSWSSTVKATLQAHKLLGFVEGTEVMPSPTILDEKAPASDKGPVLKANPAYDLWIIIDAQLRASLLALLSPVVQNLVYHCNTAAEIWSHLHQRYNSLSRTHIFQLKEQLHNLRKGQSSMQKYLDEALQIVNSLALAREPVSEQDVILNILRGLPPEYASLKQNVRTNIATVTLNSISSWLLSEELYIQLEQKLQLGSSSSSSTDLPTALFNEEFSGSSSAGTNPQAFYTAYSTDPGPNWHLDSGASTHVTSDLSRLQNPQSYYGTNSVSTAGGQSLPISHIGSGQVTTPTGISDPGQLFQSSDIQRPM